MPAAPGEPAAARIGATGWYLTGIRRSPGGSSCDLCGRTLVHLYGVVHRATGRSMTVGRGCCKQLTGWSPTVAEAARLLRAAQEEARQKAVWAEFSRMYPEAARMLEDDIRSWRPAWPGQYNLPLAVKRDICRGATPRSGWADRIDLYRRTGR